MIETPQLKYMVENELGRATVNTAPLTAIVLSRESPIAAEPDRINHPCNSVHCSNSERTFIEMAASPGQDPYVVKKTTKIAL